MSGANVQPAPVKGFLERLQDGVVVGDGAMGTMLYARGVFVNRCFDELNLSQPGPRPGRARATTSRRAPT